MKKLNLYLMVVVFGLSIFSCKKDEKTAKEYLIGKWMATAMTVSPAMDGVTDMFSTTPCDKDDIIIFNANGTVTNDEGVIKCNAADPQTTSGGTWTLSADGKTLTLTSTNNEIQVLTIVTLSSTSFVGTMTIVFNGVTYTYTVTLVKK
jgi:hypothetical protein